MRKMSWKDVGDIERIDGRACTTAATETTVSRDYS